MSKSSGDVLECDSCHLQVLAQGVDRASWKCLQVDPQKAVLSWFCCEKEPCQRAYQEAFKQAEYLWGGGGQ